MSHMSEWDPHHNVSDYVQTTLPAEKKISEVSTLGRNCKEPQEATADKLESIYWRQQNRIRKTPMVALHWNVSIQIALRSDSTLHRCRPNWKQPPQSWQASKGQPFRRRL